MSAAEVLEWFKNAKPWGDIEKVFGCDICNNPLSLEGIFEVYTPEEVVKRITAYESAKKKKPVEVEWVDICRIIQIQDNGIKKCVYEEELPDNNGYATTENILKKYISEHEGRYIAVMEGVCRVKGE